MVTSYTDRFERVIWMDASSKTDWILTENLPKCTECESHGWIAYEDATQVVLAASRCQSEGETMWSETIAIPLGMIVSRKQLEI